MRISSILSKFSKERVIGCKLKIPPSKSPPFTSQHQAWIRRYATTIGERPKVVTLSREMIKPLSQTPFHNKSIQLSLTDQLSPSIYMPIVLFYENDSNSSMNMELRSTLLKESLSGTLVHFYPLAGRIQQNELIDCNDDGVEFCEAHQFGILHKYIENPSFEDLQTLLPFQGYNPRHNNIVMSIQLNHFSCGGMAIAMCLSHKVADGAAAIGFLKAWATKATQQGDHSTIWVPKFNGASFFPPLKELNEVVGGDIQGTSVSNDRMAMRRLIFDKKTIHEIKIQANILQPTRMEAVSAFIYKHWPNKISSIMQIVNLRKRMTPPIPNDFFGNGVWFTRTSPINQTDDPQVIIQGLRESINKISGNYIRDLVFSDNLMSQLMKEAGDLHDGAEETIVCNSVSGFPVYEVDFGIGKPIWACVPIIPINNAVLAMPSKCSEGIEVWIRMHEDDITQLDYSFSRFSTAFFRKL